MDTVIYARIQALTAEMNVILVQVEGMKAANSQCPQDQLYSQQSFEDKAQQINGIAIALQNLGYEHR